MAEYKGQLRDAREARGPRKRQRTWSEANSTVENDTERVYHGQSRYLDGTAVPDFYRRKMSLASSDDNDSGSSVALPQNHLTGPYLLATNFPASYGVKEILSILNGLGREVADQSLDTYLDLVDPIHHYLPVSCLRQRYNRCWSAENLPHAHEAALVFAVLALGDLASQNLHSWFLMSASLQLLRISNFLASPTIDAICTICYFAAYLNYEGRLGEFWPVLGINVRLAQSMGLHKDPSVVLNLPVAEAELRRRVFWTIAADETALSTVFGRPNGLGSFDCNLPENISDSELLGGQKARTSAANEVTFNRYIWELASVIRNMLQTMPECSVPVTTPKLKALELRLLTWFRALPAPYRFDTNVRIPGPPEPAEIRNQYVQSVIIHIIVQHGILVLYRNPVLSRKDMALKQPCFEAAFAILESWKILQDNFPRMVRVVWMHWFRAFHAALICLVIIRTDGQDSEYRVRALSCWESTLQIFIRIKHQNESIMGCYRALDRLDVVLKKEMEINSRPKMSSHKEQRHDHSPTGTSSSTGFNPFTPTVQEFGHKLGHTFKSKSSHREVTPERTGSACPNVAFSEAPSNPMAISAALDNSQLITKRNSSCKVLYQDALPSIASSATAQPAVGRFKEFWFANLCHYPALFDIDTQKWPAWLVDPQIPH